MLRINIMSLLIKLFGFLDFTLIDLLDIFLVAIFIYFLIKLLKGTIAFNIFMGILSIYLIWWIVQALGMKMLSRILGQFIGVGVIALLVVFQQEIRKFLLLIGQNNILFTNQFKWKNILPWNWNFDSQSSIDYSDLINACKDMSNHKIGALIVVVNKVGLRGYVSTGVLLEAQLSARLLKSIFFPNNPLHDGAVIIEKDKIIAASCILPVSGNMEIPDEYGLRHRAGLGITEVSDALAIIISEETGEISMARDGIFYPNISLKTLKEALNEIGKSFIETQFMKKQSV